MFNFFFSLVPAVCLCILVSTVLFVLSVVLALCVLSESLKLLYTGIANTLRMSVC